MKHTYTVLQLQDAVASSTSFAQILRKLGLAPKGGNYQVLKRRIAKYNIPTSHITGQGWSKGRVFGSKRPLSVYLVKNGLHISTHMLRQRLLSEGILQRVCMSCSNELWLNHPIPLELHHKDGDSSNNCLDNLVLLCPNCHALTHNYRGRKKKQSIQT